MSKKTRIIIISLLILLMVACSLAIVYPLFSSWYHQQNQSEIILDYQQGVDAIEGTEDNGLNSCLLKAQEYNERLANHEFSPLEYKENGYFDLLNVTGNNVMCFVEIPKINVNLPVYHGTGADVLALGAGHMEQTSLPAGGENSHAVISAHTGMSSKVMFSDLPLLEVGDIFYITVLDKKMAYEVDQIKMVLPEQIDDIQIIPGRDLVTLSTCGPYGTNTHRLLVRGSRIEYSEDEVVDGETNSVDVQIQTQAPSVWREKYIEGILSGLLYAGCILFVVLCTVLIVRLVQNKRNHGHLKSDIKERDKDIGS